jgi:hypothetical protein
MPIHRYTVSDLKGRNYIVYATDYLSAVQGVVVMYVARVAIIFRLSGEPHGPGKFQAYVGAKKVGPEYYVR